MLLLFGEIFWLLVLCLAQERRHVLLGPFALSVQLLPGIVTQSFVHPRLQTLSSSQDLFQLCLVVDSVFVFVNVNMLTFGSKLASLAPCLVLVPHRPVLEGDIETAVIESREDG